MWETEEDEDHFYGFICLVCGSFREIMAEKAETSSFIYTCGPFVARMQLFHGSVISVLVLSLN